MEVPRRPRPTDVQNHRRSVDLRREGETIMSKPTYVRFFDEFGIDDVALVGGKNASLGEMFQKLSDQGVRVPNGFAITADAYRYILEQSGAVVKLPEDLAAEIRTAYRRLQDEYGDEVSLAVRSSATAEDLPTASFAGQQETFLNVRGTESLLDACRRCFASLFTDRAIHYRIDQGFDHPSVGLSIGIMKMVRSDISASGVFFSLDTESGFRDVVFITGD